MDGAVGPAGDPAGLAPDGSVDAGGRGIILRTANIEAGCLWDTVEKYDSIVAAYRINDPSIF